MPTKRKRLIEELGKELFEEFERGEVFGRVLDEVMTKHSEDTEEFYIELRAELMTVVVEMLGVLRDHLTLSQGTVVGGKGKGKSSGVAAKLDDGKIEVVKGCSIIAFKRMLGKTQVQTQRGSKEDGCEQERT